MFIDRFEGDYAVLEKDGKTCNIQRELLPTTAREGDVVVWKEGRWNVDPEATARRKAKITSLAENLWRDE